MKSLRRLPPVCSCDGLSTHLSHLGDELVSRPSPWTMLCICHTADGCSPLASISLWVSANVPAMAYTARTVSPSCALSDLISSLSLLTLICFALPPKLSKHAVISGFWACRYLCPECFSPRVPMACSFPAFKALLECHPV